MQFLPNVKAFMRLLEGNALLHTDKNIIEGYLEGMGSKVINNS
jgi:hypothetical protein